MKSESLRHCFLCGSDKFTSVFVYNEPPKGEIRFRFSSTATYHREVWRCAVCGHYLSVHDLDMNDLYNRDYISATYGDENGIGRAFDRITSLAPDHSDNKGRVRRIQEFVKSHVRSTVQGKEKLTVLDVGSGLCVFLNQMRKAGWDCVALDTDPRYLNHARERVGVETYCGDFLKAAGLGTFDLITFNKVLEHIENPMAMLQKSLQYISGRGLVYVEVPDGEAAQEAGPEREEFFIEHHHVFSMVSLAMLTAKAGFRACQMERLREPSGKYTLRTFLKAE